MGKPFESNRTGEDRAQGARGEKRSDGGVFPSVSDLVKRTREGSTVIHSLHDRVMSFVLDELDFEIPHEVRQQVLDKYVIPLGNSVAENARLLDANARRLAAAQFSLYHLIGAGVLPLLIFGLYKFGFTRFKRASDIPKKFFGGQKLRGYALAVNDSDNVRFYHCPRMNPFRPGLANGKITANTINVRLAGIDSPECSHFGLEGQPFSVEAKDYLTRLVLNRPVTVYPHRIDQYGRLVASVYYSPGVLLGLILPFYKRNLSLDMVVAGYATVYTASGAEYGGQYEALVGAERTARAKRRGMWSQNMDLYVSPAEHKSKAK